MIRRTANADARDACQMTHFPATQAPPIQNLLPLLLRKATFGYAPMWLYLSYRQRFTTRIRRGPGAICHSGSPRAGGPAARLFWSAVARHSFGFSRSQRVGAHRPWRGPRTPGEARSACIQSGVEPPQSTIHAAPGPPACAPRALVHTDLRISCPSSPCRPPRPLFRPLRSWR